MSEQDLQQMLVRTSARLRRTYYVVDFLLHKWDILSIEAKREFLEALREDMANFLPSIENWRIFQEAPDRQPKAPTLPEPPEAPTASEAAWW